MTNIEPRVIINDVPKMAVQKYGNAGKVALVGAFPTSSVKIAVYEDALSAKNGLKGTYKLPGDTDPAHASQTEVPSTYTSFFCLDYIFNNNESSTGPESVLVVNTNYGLETLVTAVTNSTLASALAEIADEDFDILTVADNVKLAVMDSSTAVINPMWSTMKSFVDTQDANKKPFGIITGVEVDSNATTTIVTAFKTLFDDKGIYKAVCTPVKMNGASVSLNMAQSGCYHSAFTAGRAVNKSETSKIYPDIIGEVTKETNPTSATITYQNLLDAGFLTTKYRKRKDSIVQCLSNITPADYDMKIERVKNYITKRLTLEDVLGDDNTKVTLAYVEGLFKYEKDLAIDNGLLLDMNYSITSVDTDEIECDLEYIIADVVRTITVNQTLTISMED